MLCRSALRPALAAALAALLACSGAPGAVRAQAPDAGVLTLVDQTAGVSYAVASDGATRAVLGAGRRAYVLDVAADGTTTVAGRTPILPATVRALLLDGTRLFVAPEGRGIHIFNIADPAAPTEIGVIPVTHEVREMVLHEGRLVTAEFGEGVAIYDVTGDDVPVAPLAVEHTRRAVTYVAVQDDLVYAAYATEGLGIIDISTPTEPRYLGQAELPPNGKAESIEVAGTTALMAAGSALGIYDVANPREPELIGTVQNGTVIRTVAVVGSTLYVGHGTQGVGVYDFTTPAAPTLLRTLPTLNDVVRMRSVGTRLFVVDWLAGLTLYDVATADAPPIGKVSDVAGLPFGLAQAGGNAFVGFAHDRVSVIDVVTMREVASAPLPPASQDVYVDVADDRLAVGDVRTGLDLFDVADPRAPQPLVHLEAQVRDLLLLDARTLITTGGTQGLATWDLTDPAQPQRRLRTPTTAFMWGLAADAANVFVADRENGVIVYAARPESAWRIVGRVELGTDQAEARDVAFLDPDTVAVAADEGGLYVVDVSDRAAPAVVGILNTRFVPTVLTVRDDLVFAGGRSRGIAVFDVADRARPRFVGLHDLSTAVSSLTWSEDRLFAAAGNEGVLAFELGTIPPPGTVVSERGPLADAPSTPAPDGNSGIVQQAPQPTPGRWRTGLVVLGGVAIALAAIAIGRAARRRRLRSDEPSVDGS